MHKGCRRKRLCFATLLAACTLLRNASSQALPSALQSVVPTCAQSCLQEAIDEDFVPAICSSAYEFDCLCANYGVDGYTLGERAFGCLYTGNCTAASQANATTVYTICSGVNGAVTPTHSTVVVTASTPTPTSSNGPASSTPSTTTIAASSGPTTASSLASTATQASMVSSPTSTPSSSGRSTQLTEAQVAGIAIASIALVVLTVGIAGCLLFIRRRNKNLEQEEAKLLFHHSRNGSGSQTSNLGTPRKDPRGGPGGVGIVPIERSPRPGVPPPVPTPAPLERTWPRYYPIMPGDTFMPRQPASSVPQDGIGVAQTTNVPSQMPETPMALPVPVTTATPIRAPEPAMIAPPQLNQAQRSFTAAPDQVATSYVPFRPSASQPMPPSYSPPQPLSKRARQSIDRTAVISQITEFEEEASLRSGPCSPTFLSRESQPEEIRGRLQERPIVPSIRATSGSPRLQALRPSTLKIQIPSYPTTTPGASQPTLVATTQGPLSQDQQFVLPPPPARARSQPQQTPIGPTNFPLPPSLFDKRSSPPNDAQQRTAAPNAVNQLSSRPSTSQKATVGVSVPTAANLVRNEGAKRAKRSKRKSQRSNPEPGRDSMASYTSFESVGSSSDPTPPKEEDRQLTPPKEGGSPISNLRYPKVPRSTSQAVSRIPPSPKLRERTDKLSPNKISPTPSPRNNNSKAATSPRGVADHLWRTEVRGQDGSPRSNQYAAPGYRPQDGMNKVESNRPLNVYTAGPSQSPAKSSSQKPMAGEPEGWNWTPELTAAFAQFNPKSPFGTMPKLTPTKQGEDLYLSVSRE